MATADRSGHNIRFGFSPSGPVSPVFHGVSSTASYSFETLKVSELKPFVYHVQINRPQRMNAMNSVLYREMRECFQQISEDKSCRVVIISGNGKGFSSGIDLQDMMSMNNFDEDFDTARKALHLKKMLNQYQAAFTAIEKCPKIVIAAVHGFCIGAGVDLITACDIRYCSKDAYFQIKEVDIGLAADLGTLQRLPKIIGNTSTVMEWAVTARRFNSEEADHLGLVSRVYSDPEHLFTSSLEMATLIASKSPVAVQGTKLMLNYSRDHTVDESLDYMSTWNMTMLQSEDVVKAAMAAMDKSGPPPNFSKL